MEQLVQEAGSDYQHSDMARVHINHPDLNHYIIVPPRALGELNADVVMNAVENVLQSEEHLTLNDKFTVQVAVAHMGQGGRGKCKAEYPR